MYLIVELLASGISYLIYFCIIYHIISSVFREFYNLFRSFTPRMTSDSWRVYEINDEWECKKACNYLKKECEDLKVLGFDCEWVSLNGKQQPVALLQLASANGTCGLFRLNNLKQIPDELKQLLSDKHIIKMGVCALNDAMLLLNDYQAEVNSTLDLRHLYPTATGLGSLANMVLGVELNKDWRISCSNWESSKLTDEQIKYAAEDAIVAIKIFKKWIEDSAGFKGATFSPQLQLIIHRYLDIRFVSTLIKKEETGTFSGGINLNNKGIYAARKSPLYDNCFMNAPDGTLLCSSDKRKAQWYVDRGLAKVLLCEPYTIQLLFEPAARGDESSNAEFYRQLKQNCCVVCGAAESYLKHYVVPREYRKHFPPIMKDHQSHDIVLMCVQCHFLAGQHNENLKRVLADFCNAPIHRGKDTDPEEKIIRKVKNCAKALVAADKAIPQKRKLELENEVKQFYKIDTLGATILQKAINLESKVKNDNAHGIKVVNYFKTSGPGLKELEFIWRKHFLTTMKPKYLPTFWSTTHNHSRLTE